MSTPIRCAWVSEDPLYIAYHDHEWGIPVYNDQLLFEFLILEGMQAGLNWFTILKKRPHFRKAFHNFNPEKIARFSTKKVEQLLTNADIIRNRLKINACIQNAKAYLAITAHHPNFSTFMWQFVDGKPITNRWRSTKEVPTQTKISENMSKVLKENGFKFVGPTICYALMQAVGMVNDHTLDCFCHP